MVHKELLIMAPLKQGGARHAQKYEAFLISKTQQKQTEPQNKPYLPSKNR